MADAIQQLPTKHVAFHLLREALSWGKIQYWARTSPREYISTLLEAFHTIQRQCLEGILGKPLTSAQWLQSRLPDRCGGLGLLACRYEQGMQVFQVADLAYLVSRRQSHSHVARLVPGYEQIVPTLEASAVQHLTAFLPIGQDEINHPEHALDQSQILDRMYNSVFQTLFDGSTLSVQVLLRSVAAPGANAWLHHAPSPTRDLLYSNAAFVDVVSLRLGISLFDEGDVCPYCSHALDPYGHHILGCIRQGCKSGIHNSLRNTVFRYARLAGLNPVLEATGLLPDDPNCRPADVLISAPPTLRQNSWSKYPRVALDVAVTSPFQSSALATNATGALRAASQYAQRKRAHAAIAARCAAVDLGFEPIVFESLGGIEQGARDLLVSLCGRVDERSRRAAGCSFQECLGRLNFDLQRGLHRAIEAHRMLRMGHLMGPNAIATFLDLCE